MNYIQYTDPAVDTRMFFYENKVWLNKCLYQIENIINRYTLCGFGDLLGGNMPQ